MVEIESWKKQFLISTIELKKIKKKCQKIKKLKLKNKMIKIDVRASECNCT